MFEFDERRTNGCRQDRSGPRKLLGRTLVVALAAGVLTPAMALPAAAEPPKPSPTTKAPAPEGVTVDLRPKYRIGRDIRYQFELSSDNRLKSTVTPEIDGDQTLTQSILLKVHPVEVTEEGYTVELVYERIKASLSTADFKASFDSNSPGGGGGGRAPSGPQTPTRPSRTKNPSSTPSKPAGGGGGGGGGGASGTTDADMNDLLAQIMRPMVGTKLTMKLDRDGNIKSVTGGEALAGSGVSGLEGLLGQGGLSGLGGLGGIGGVPMPTAGNPGPMGWIINGPGQRATVRVGETWTNNDSLSGTPIGGFTMVTRHTCKSASPTSANFTFAGRADAQSSGQGDGGAGGAGLGGLLGGFALKESNYGGTYTWDTGRGELKDMTGTLTTRIEQASGNEGSTQLSGESRMSVRRVE